MQNLDTSWTLIKNDRKILAEIKFRSSRSLHIPKKKNQVHEPMARSLSPGVGPAAVGAVEAAGMASSFSRFWPEWMLGFLVVQPFNQSYETYEIFLPISARPLRRTCFRCAPCWLFWFSLRGREGGRHAREKVGQMNARLQENQRKRSSEQYAAELNHVRGKFTLPQLSKSPTNALWTPQKSYAFEARACSTGTLWLASQASPDLEIDIACRLCPLP